MKRSFQEVVELVVFGLIALLIGVGLLWLVGWVLGLVGLLMKFLAGLIWWLLRYIVPIAIVAGLIYFLVRVLQGDRSGRSVPATAAPGTSATAPAPVTGGTAAAPSAADAPEHGTQDAAPETAGGEGEGHTEAAPEPGPPAEGGTPADAEGHEGEGPEPDEGEDRRHN